MDYLPVPGEPQFLEFICANVEGFCVHIAAKLASHTLRLLLKRRFTIDVLTFRQAIASLS